MKVALIWAGVMLASSTISVPPLLADTLSREQAEQEVNRLLQKRSGDASRHIKLTEVLGCLPASGEPDTVWVCPIKFADYEHPLEFTFVNAGGVATARENDADAACPSLQLAEKALRQIDGDPTLRVRGEVDDGKGLFTSDRGMLRKQKGKYRLMCRYEISNAVFNDRLYLTYVWYGPAGYIFDNAACEGFFGRMKTELFYSRDWKAITIEQFVAEADAYIRWYNEKRIKISLGSLSPVEYRQSLGLNL